MELSEYKRISIGRDWWFSIQPDKMVFGGRFLPDDIHCTFSFGLKSGYFDLHLRKDITANSKAYFPVVRICTKDIFDCINPLKLRFLDAVFTGLEEITEDVFIENAIGLIPLYDENQPADEKFINEILNEIIIPKNKRKLNIDYKDQAFELKAESFAEKYAEKWKEKIKKPGEIMNMNFGTGILFKKDSRRMFIKISIGESYKIFLFDSLDLDHLNVIKKILGQDLFELLSTRFNEGIEKLKVLTEPEEFEALILNLSLSLDDSNP
jgi:hypothetical protein